MRGQPRNVDSANDNYRPQVGSEKIACAPRSPAATTEIFKKSSLARDWLGDDFVEHFALTREWEWRQWQDGVTDWELKRYFEIV